MAGPRFLSVCFMIRPLFWHSACSLLSCGMVRLFGLARVLFLHLSCFSFKEFLKASRLSSIIGGAGGGCQLQFLMYNCFMYSESGRILHCCR